jgi:Nuclease A inhibitor-like protein
MQTNHDFTNALRQATENLLWISESDFPLELVEWQDMTMTELTIETLLDKTQHPAQTSVELVDVDAFFAGTTTIQSWYGEAETAIATRYQQLLALLKAHLQNLQVYRIGTITIDVYVLGDYLPSNPEHTDLGQDLTMQGTIAGFFTQIVET